MRIKRALVLPSKTFLLLGPRGTGKSTLIRDKLHVDLEINLLKSDQFLPFSQNPTLLQNRVKDFKPGSWVFIDEIQKIPALMDEIHSAYEEFRLNFALSGSSARKLRRGGVNLLGGRALVAELFPFVFQEWKDSGISFSEVLEWGSLPLVITDPQNRAETLMSYVETYLRQELIEEGLIRKLEPFARFLRVTGLYHAQILNVENIARESHLARSVVSNYFEVLEETLIGFMLQPLHAKVKRKEVTHPKFYLFDTGVARACAGLVGEELDSVWLGFALESYLLHEVRAYNSYSKKRRDLFYYKYSDGYEIDLVVETRKKTLSQSQELVLMEIKANRRWDPKWNLAMIDFKKNSRSKIKACYGIYQGTDTQIFDGITVLPVFEFLERLKNGEIF